MFFNTIKKDHLNETNLVGDVKSIDISSQTNESLLVTIRSDEGVDLSSFNIIKTLDGILDLVLVGLDIDEEGQGVVFLNLLHGSLGIERLTNDTVLIHTRSMGNRLASVLGSTVQNQSLGDVKVGGSADLANCLTVNTLESGLLGVKSLGGSY
jgi:nitrate reductase NapAB chaperone NapD